MDQLVIVDQPDGRLVQAALDPLDLIPRLVDLAMATDRALFMIAARRLAAMVRPIG